MRPLGTSGAVALVHPFLFLSVISSSSIGDFVLSTSSQLPPTTTSSLLSTSSPPLSTIPAATRGGDASKNTEDVALIPQNAISSSLLVPQSITHNVATSATSDITELPFSTAATETSGNNRSDGSEPIESSGPPGKGGGLCYLAVRDNDQTLFKRCPAVPIALSSAGALVAPAPSPKPEAPHQQPSAQVSDAPPVAVPPDSAALQPPAQLQPPKPIPDSDSNPPQQSGESSQDGTSPPRLSPPAPEPPAEAPRFPKPEMPNQSKEIGSQPPEIPSSQPESSDYISETDNPSDPPVQVPKPPKTGLGNPVPHDSNPSSIHQAGTQKENPEHSLPENSPVQQEAQPPPLITVGPSVYAYHADASSNLFIASHTLVPGGPELSLNGYSVRLGHDGTNFVVNGQPIPVQHAAQVQAQDINSPALTVGGFTIAPNSDGFYVVGGQTVTPGAAPITISGTPVSVPITDKPVLTVGRETIAPNSDGFYVIAGQTITPGASAVTISGTPVSVPSSLMPSPTEGIIHLGSSTLPYSLNLAGNIVVASETLQPGGPAVTVAEQTLSEASNGQSIVMVSEGKTTTEPLNFVLTPTRAQGLTGLYKATASATAAGFNISISSALSGVPSGSNPPTTSDSVQPLPGAPFTAESKTVSAAKISDAGIYLCFLLIGIMLVTSGLI